jgi:hypothetical protein
MLSLGAVVSCFRALSLSVALAAPFVGAALAAGPAVAERPANNGSWAALTPAQQQVLQPLARDWQQLSPEGQRKWLEIAARFPSLAPAKQARLQQRMTDWARLTPEQRGQARANFQQARQLPSQQRQTQWEAYQALPREQKDALALKAAKPVPPAAGPAVPSRSLRGAPLDAQAPKSNLVAPNGTDATRPTRVVTPSVVQRGPGATTNLVSAPARPPEHQPSGRPKIDAGPTRVDRSTLLPRQGPQAASAASAATAR